MRSPSFSDLETISATRVSLLRSVRQKEQREQIGDLVTPFCQSIIDLEARCLLQLSEAARQADQPQIALNSVVRAQSLLAKQNFDVSQEFADVFWKKMEPKIAVQYLQQLLSITHRDKNADVQTRSLAEALLLAKLVSAVRTYNIPGSSNNLSFKGTWTSEACFEKPARISSSYFQPASVLALKSIRDLHHAGDASEIATVFHKFAIFAEKQYHTIDKSPDVLRFKVYVERKRREVTQRKEKLEKAQRSTATEAAKLGRELRNAEVMLETDLRQYEDFTATRDTFLMQAVEMYSRALETSDTFDDDSAIRLCSLWFANFLYTEKNFQSKIGEALNRVPSHKFVFLAHQLSARISSQTIHDNVRQLLVRMCREHPFHSLYQVFCLRTDHSEPSPLTRRQSRHNESPSSQVERSAAAMNVFDLLRSDPSCQKRVSDLESVCFASLGWARYPLKRMTDEKKPIPPVIPEELSIRKLRHIKVPVITIQLPVDKTGQYELCVWIDRFEEKYSTAGGMNLPKISNCIGSDGRKYKQLVSYQIFVRFLFARMTFVVCLRSIKGKVTLRMIFVRTLLWNKSSIFAIWCCAKTGKPGKETWGSEVIK